MTKRPKRGMKMVLGFLFPSSVAVSLLIGGAPPWGRAQEPDNQASIDLHTEQPAEQILRLLEAHIEKLQARIPPIRNEIEELTREVQSFQSSETSPPPGPGDDATEVPYRPPLEQLALGRLPIGFACQEGRVSFIDFDAMNKRAKEMRDKRDAKSTIRESHQLAVPNTDFLYQLVMEGKLNSPDFTYKVVLTRHPDSLGKSWEEIRQPGSRFQRILASHRSSKPAEPPKRYVTFFVWPDSYDVFRQARTLAWEEGYDVGWEPIDAAETLELGRGVGTIN